MGYKVPEWPEGLVADGLEIEALAPAKINLSLEVLGRRPDGYHELRGLMARLAFGDVVRLRLTDAPEDELSFGFPDLGQNEPYPMDPGFDGPGNLALRAARLFREAAGWPHKALAVHLEKSIPLASGLGGGSSDAAAVLKLLEASAGEKALGERRLRELALSLGADVPFYLAQGPLQWAEGIGEKLTPFTGRLPGDRVLLVNPGRPLSTGEVFRRLGLTSGQSSSNSLDAAARLSTGPGDPRPPLGYNDLLAPALSLDPELAETEALLARLSPRPLYSGMSGSGPTFWALYASAEDLVAAAGSLAGLVASQGGERPGRRFRVVTTRVA
jgi:4-diphosphocytidyl-2-C-methyl-D-erythritol kinase